MVWLLHYVRLNSLSCLVLQRAAALLLEDRHNTCVREQITGVTPLGRENLSRLHSIRPSWSEQFQLHCIWKIAHSLILHQFYKWRVCGSRCLIWCLWTVQAHLFVLCGLTLSAKITMCVFWKRSWLVRAGEQSGCPGGLSQPDSALGVGASPGGRQGPLGRAEPAGRAQRGRPLALPLLVPHRAHTEMVLVQHQARAPAHYVTRFFSQAALLILPQWWM